MSDTKTLPKEVKTFKIETCRETFIVFALSMGEAVDLVETLFPDHCPIAKASQVFPGTIVIAPNVEARLVDPPAVNDASSEEPG